MDLNFETVLLQDDLHPIVKLESIEELSDHRPSTSDAAETETKIGEIFHVRKDQFKFVCVHCIAEFPLLKPFVKHVQQHLKDIYANSNATKQGIVFNDKEVLSAKIEYDDNLMDEATASPDENFVNSSKALTPGHALSNNENAFQSDDKAAHSSAKYYSASSEKAYSCNICNLKLARKWGLIRHMKNQHPTAPRAVRTTTKKKVKATKKKANTAEPSSVTGPPFQCPECDKSFIYADYLKAHRDRHIGKSRVQCQECGRFFAARDKLKRHMITHTGEAPCECDVCHKRFRDASSVAIHKIVHTREYVHYCKPCQKGFSERRGLKKHNQRWHPAETN